MVARLAQQHGGADGGGGDEAVRLRGPRRMRQADEGLAELRAEVDTLIVIPNQRLLAVVEQDGRSPTRSASRRDPAQGHQGISDLVTVPGLVNLDFADVKAVMSNRGNALMGTRRAAVRPGARGGAGGGVEPAARGRVDLRSRGRAA